MVIIASPLQTVTVYDERVLHKVTRNPVIRVLCW